MSNEHNESGDRPNNDGNRDFGQNPQIHQNAQNMSFQEPQPICPWNAATGFSGVCNFLTSPELKQISKNWKYFFTLGIGLMILGGLAIGSSFFTTVLTVSIVGVLLMIGGVTQIVNSFYTGKWGGFFLHVALGVLYLVVGFMLLDAPILNAITLTFLLAGFFILAGLFRIIASLTTQLPGWGWALCNGLITFVLGALIYRQWPTSGLWVIGLFVGIEMIFAGWYWTMFATTLRTCLAANPNAEDASRQQPQGV